MRNMRKDILLLVALFGGVSCGSRPSSSTVGSGGSGSGGTAAGKGSGGHTSLAGRTGTGGNVATGGSGGRAGSGGMIAGHGGAAGDSMATGGKGGSAGSAGRPGGSGGASGSAGATSGSGGGAGAGPGGSTGTGVAVTTFRYDNLRSGANLRETALTTGNVNASSFGLLFSRQVDGQVYAQPLLVPGLTMADHKVHDVVYVATEHDTVFAFDATDAAQTAPLWSLNVGPSGSNSCDNLSPEVGITSTPVIDQSAGIIYFVSKSQQAGAWVQRIHAVDLVTGKERPGSPAVLSAAVNGTGAGSSGGRVAFDAGTQLNRTGLLLVDGVVYAAFASHCDQGNYHGWVLAYRYDGATFKQTLAYNVSPNGKQGGIWQGGNGLASDGESVFVVAGNGSTNPAPASLDLSQSVFRLRISDYSVQDYWIPSAYSGLNAADSDLSSGAILMPHNLLLTGSKDGRLYLLDATNLGKYVAGGDKILQTLTTPGKASGSRGHIHGGPIYYQTPAGDERVFLWPEDSPLMAYTLNAASRTLGGLITDPVKAAGFTPGHPGATLMLSANGSAAGTGILWSTLPTQNGTNGAWHTTSAGALYALDATDVTKVLWRDDNGTWNVAKFAPPVVANGRVYVGTFSNSLRVYGLTK